MAEAAYTPHVELDIKGAAGVRVWWKQLTCESVCQDWCIPMALSEGVPAL